MRHTEQHGTKECEFFPDSEGHSGNLLAWRRYLKIDSDNAGFETGFWQWDVKATNRWLNPKRVRWGYFIEVLYCPVA